MNLLNLYTICMDPVFYLIYYGKKVLLPCLKHAETGINIKQLMDHIFFLQLNNHLSNHMSIHINEASI
jgi:hypothetical protein